MIYPDENNLSPHSSSNQHTSTNQSDSKFIYPCLIILYIIIIIISSSWLFASQGFTLLPISYTGLASIFSIGLTANYIKHKKESEPQITEQSRSRFDCSQTKKEALNDWIESVPQLAPDATAIPKFTRSTNKPMSSDTFFATPLPPNLQSNCVRSTAASSAYSASITNAENSSQPPIIPYASRISIPGRISEEPEDVAIAINSSRFTP